ncbi:extracellular solute-binding protein [Lactococcus taiwanensis]|uniref:extracellular solute-binding protein n=1 Tax=Lactococcus taiwanensis TaxID=1151742 RepID=UPI0028A121C7|nr:extracellular solute-binding protein [Lactococcus taiwanensis]
MKSWKKIALGGASVLAVTTLAACGNSTSGSKTSSSSSDKLSGTVRLYVDVAQKPAFQKVVDDFTKDNKDVTVKVIANASGSANAKTDIAKDPAKYADVFAVPNDQLGDMADKGYINQIAPKYAKEAKNNDSKTAYEGMEYRGKLYAMPMEVQAQTLFYNKSKLTADDVKSWDTLTSKGVVASDLTVPYNFGPIFQSAGVKLFGENGEDVKGSTYNTSAGIAALNWFAAQKSNKGVMQTTNALNQLQSGKADAILDGPWDTANVKKVLGDNYAVAPYPTITLDGQQKQMQAFLGIHGFAVNSKAKAPAVAQALAAYITKESAQLALFKDQGLVPANTDAQMNSDVKADAAAQAVLTMSKSDHSTLMPKLPQMATYWNVLGPVINGAYTGKITPAQYKDQLQKLQDAISK